MTTKKKTTPHRIAAKTGSESYHLNEFITFIIPPNLDMRFTFLRHNITERVTWRPVYLSRQDAYILFCVDSDIYSKVCFIHKMAL